MKMVNFFGLGELPAEYNPKVHGPYDPSVFYGKSKSELTTVTVFLVSRVSSKSNF